MRRAGFIGWRGMVGSVLMQRMREENDFALVEPTFFTTSQTGGKSPDIGREVPPLKDAYDIDELRSMDILVSCQGGDYTSAIFGKLREAGWKGHWIDAASTLRMGAPAFRWRCASTTSACRACSSAARRRAFTCRTWRSDV